MSKDIYKIIPDNIHPHNIERFKRTNFYEYKKDKKTSPQDIPIYPFTPQRILDIYNIVTVSDFTNYLNDILDNKIIQYIDLTDNKPYIYYPPNSPSNFPDNLDISMTDIIVYPLPFYNPLNISQYIYDLYIQFNTINRLFNSYIIVNYNTFKTHLSQIISYANKLLPLTYNMDKKDKTKIEKYIKDYTIYWFEKNDGLNFNLDLLNNMNLYIKEKLNS